MKDNFDYSYIESNEALKIRINAHKNYSKFSLEDYIEQNYSFVGKYIIDIGCGNGNMTGLLSKEAMLYIGIEKNKELLYEAYSKFSSYPYLFFIMQDMDSDLFLPHDLFDYIFFIYSSYYSNNPKILFNNLKKNLKKNGRLILIGPTKNNAVEIEDFCLQLFNFKNVSEKRAIRLESEFKPLLDELGYNTELLKINFDLIFPNASEYLKYIMSTLQYRNSYNGTFDKNIADDLLFEKYRLKLTKEVITICAKK